MPGGEPRVDRVEARAVVPPEVAGGHHSGEEHREAVFGECAEQPIQVRMGDRRVDCAQGIVCPERHDDRVGTVGQRPFEPREPPGRGIARDPGVDHPRVEPTTAQRRLQPGGKRVAGSEPVARGEAVAEHEDAQLIGAGLGPESGRGQHQPCQQPRSRYAYRPSARPRSGRRLVPLRNRALEMLAGLSRTTHHRID